MFQLSPWVCLHKKVVLTFVTPVQNYVNWITFCFRVRGSENSTFVPFLPIPEATVRGNVSSDGYNVDFVRTIRVSAIN